MIKNLCCKTIPTLRQCNQTDLQLITHYPGVFQLIGEVKWDSPSMPFFYPVSPQAHLQTNLRLQTTHTGWVFFVVCVAFPPSPEMLKCKAGMWDAVGGAWSCMGRQWGAGGGLPITHKDERTGKALEKLLHWQPAAFPPPFCILERFCERQ